MIVNQVELEGACYPMTIKSEIRVNILNQLKMLDPIEKKHIEEKMYEIIFQSSIWEKAKVIGITCSQPFEWDTLPIIEKVWKLNKIVAVPKSSPIDKQLQFYQLTHVNELVRGYANILEPDIEKTTKISNHEIDLLFVPGIAFDKLGYRIGFGGGYYDRYLQYQQLNTVSLVANFQMVKRIPINEFDVPVQYLVTETNWIHIENDKKKD